MTTASCVATPGHIKFLYVPKGSAVAPETRLIRVYGCIQDFFWGEERELSNNVCNFIHSMPNGVRM